MVLQPNPFTSLSPLQRRTARNSAMPDLDGTIFACDYRARLAYVMIFDHRPHVHIFTYDIHTSRTDVVGLIYTTRSDVKSRRMLVAHDSRK